MGIALVLGAGACKADPSAGESCLGSEVILACSDTTTMLVCDDAADRWLSAPCPGGCTQSDSKLVCDLGDAGEGLPCVEHARAPYHHGRCTADGEALLACRGGRFVSHPVRGPGGCRDAARDHSIARVGDPCTESYHGERHAMRGCSEDGKALLVCPTEVVRDSLRDGVWEVAEVCPNGCRVEGGTARCVAE